MSMDGFGRNTLSVFRYLRVLKSIEVEVSELYILNNEVGT